MPASHPSARIKITSPPGSEQEYQLKNTRYEIGSNSDADIIHHDLLIQHAVVLFESGEWIFRRTHPSARTTFKGHPVEIKKLNHLDSIDLGGVQMLFLYDQIDTGTAETILDSELLIHGISRLRVIKGPDRGRVFNLRPGEYIIGRDNEGESTRIVLKDPYVSKTHVLLKMSNQTALLSDLCSKNGIRIGLRRIQNKEMNLPIRFRIGRSVLLLEKPGTPSGVKTTQIMRRKKIQLPWLVVLGVVILLTAVFLIIRSIS